MGLDIYAGTLTRYYAHNWKTVTQQWAEQNGCGFQRIAPEEGWEKLSPAQIQKSVEAWRDQILNAITGPNQKPYAPWTEDNKKPYFTDKPDWDAFGALLLVAACHVYEDPVPFTVPKDWKFMEHPSIKRLSEDGEKFWSLFRGTDWWLPLPDSMLFRVPLPTGDQRMLATTAILRDELKRINAMVWKAQEDTILSWSRTEGYPADGSIGVGGGITMEKEHLQYDTQSLAKFAFSLFWQALKFAEENQVPILLDY